MHKFSGDSLLKDYYKYWVVIYKQGAVREVTLQKYRQSLKWIEKLAPELRLSEITRSTYQKLMNDYAVDS